ncbi:MAG: hypothetical protein CML68_14100 [Rhodobacteraceae bacterium]|nr:hypothetical protein [Paracoccaceae bacterium]
MNEQYEFPTGEHQIVYVKTVEVADLPEEVQAEAEGLDQIYAVHDAEGQQLALVADRKMAFVLARQNDYAPVSLH